MWGFLGRLAVLVAKSIFLDSGLVVGHSVLPALKVCRGMGQTAEPCGDLSYARAVVGPVGVQSSPEEVCGEERDLEP